ncbi:indole-3-glycerol phosphate synthase TrpC [Fulvivirga lutimaris]|uniref:indole-3-glycerol phosphate synthase TrpC n=1 Tax=Fulvivirga lutimaris TaxID=1819566 RepID=UPI0012BD5CB4|nr:indole-3-glycerol phosphate synthase TrpC [Fulvivirga lutimaris]MTI38959.1 indole-3-glycerol phosphate synthase TrpC [Fulvivirga lutimaris]
MDILEKIIAHKYKEVEERKSLFPTKLLEKSIYFNSDTVSLKKYILREDKSGIIAEIKRKSPSKGTINAHVSIERTSIGYMQAGASALSVLTDTDFFGGKNEDLITARKFNFCPILRKDFTVDEYQIVEAKSIGADAVLLIAAALEPVILKQLAAFAQSLGLETLLEVHNEEELNSSVNEHIDLVGVNNRNLKTFEVSIETSKSLASLIPSKFVKVSESGISDPRTIMDLRAVGFQGFLMGERFMQNSRPEKACARFIESLSQLEKNLYV